MPPSPACSMSMVAVRNVEPHPNGNSFDWDYKLLGLRILGHSDPVDLVQYERQVTRSVKGIPNTFHYKVPVFGRLEV